MDKAKRMSKVKDLKPSPPATSGKRKRKDVNYASVGGTDPCPVCDRDQDSAHEDKTICRAAGGENVWATVVKRPEQSVFNF